MVSDKITNCIKYIGKNIKPYWPTAAVASAELIFRPMFTMMDKKSPPETKKYTALREAVTELIAAPTYIVIPVLAAKAANLLKNADKKTVGMAKHNLQILGTWTAALVIIPGLCSAVVKPFMDKIYNKKDDKKNEPARLDVTSKTTEIEPVHTPISQTGNITKNLPMYQISMANFANSNMKVGG